MGLITKPPSWARFTTNLIGTPGTVTHGTAFTPGQSNADGTAVTLLSALAHDIEYLIIGIEGISANAAISDCLLDILIDPAGGTSWASLIDDLICGYTLKAEAFAGYPLYYHFPLWIPAGASIGAQARCRRPTTSITTGSCFIAGYGGNVNPGSWWCGQKVSSIGIDAANSGGTVHTPGNSGAYSAWTDFGSTLPAPCGALQYGVQPSNNAVLSAVTYFMEFGVASTRIGTNILLLQDGTETSWRMPGGLIFASLPAGTQLQTRGTCSGTAQALQVGAYAVH